MTMEQLIAIANHYRKALYDIREDEVPFTRAWRIANHALQNAPQPSNAKQLELFTDEQ